MFNVYDQSNNVKYPDYSAGYWQRQLTPAELPSRDIYTHFTTKFSDELATINQWKNGDFVLGVFQFGNSLYLARVHNGGEDSRGRPQRWVLYVWREENVSAGNALDIGEWFIDPEWPGRFAPVPLPAPLPSEAYSAHIFPATPFPDGELPRGGRVEVSVDSLDDAIRLWKKWSSAPIPRRAENGFLLYSSVAGNRKCFYELELRESETYFAEKAAEDRRKIEEKKRLLRASEEAERIRVERERREKEIRLREKEEAWHNRGILFLKIAVVILAILCVAQAAFIAYFLLYRNPFGNSIPAEKPVIETSESPKGTELPKAIETPKGIETSSVEKKSGETASRRDP